MGIIAIKMLLRGQIFEGKLSVSPYSLHYFQDNIKAGMLLVDKLSLMTLGVYHFIIFWPKKWFEVCDSNENKQKNDSF